MAKKSFLSECVQKSRSLVEIIVKNSDELKNVDGRFDSLKVEEFCNKNSLIEGGRKGENWASHSYQYVLSHLFPEVADFSVDERVYRGVIVFLNLMRQLYVIEEKSVSFDPTYDFKMLSEKEVIEEGYTREYLTLLKKTEELYIYEFMRIGADIKPFNTVGHIGGVHYVAMMVATQLKKAGVNVDLALVSGAAAGHDMGKYGCKKREEKRIPYLHYYYTDELFKKSGMNTIGHIASNHSTWDLELENLSVESLILIYADFRVRSFRDEEGREKVYFADLLESYNIILSKLDNVDEKKKKRYEKVYHKLSDFQAFIVEQGVETNIDTDNYLFYLDTKVVPQQRDSVLLGGNEITRQLKFRAIDHNIRVMSGFHPEREFGNIIEAAKSEYLWKNLRTYIRIFGEYSTYMTEEQKTLTLGFLYEMLVHKEGDIRHQSSKVMGKIISNYSEGFKKEVPEGLRIPSRLEKNLNMFRTYLDKILYPNNKYTKQHRARMGRTLGSFIMTVLSYCEVQIRGKYLEVLGEYYRKEKEDLEQVMILLAALIDFPRDLVDESFLKVVDAFVEKYLDDTTDEIRVAAVLVKSSLFSKDKDWKFNQLSKILNISAEEDFSVYLGTMFLNNLKLATPWITKIANILFMEKYATNYYRDANLLHIATHLANLIKVSEVIAVRQKAGEALLTIVKMLPMEQRNEIAVELFNGLETGETQFSKYIPAYLGRIVLDLPPRELDEFISDMKRILERDDDKPAPAVLNTLGVMLTYYDGYRGNFWEEREVVLTRKKLITNIIIKSFASYREVIEEEAFVTLGNWIFDSSIMEDEEKTWYFTTFGKKILAILDEKEENTLGFFSNSAVLNTIYRFISQHETDRGNFQFEEKRQIAFFPGTFDPFSLGHKAITETIRNRGMEVYLALDEFSWSKKTQPRMLRRKIMLMSTADQDDVYIFPDDVSINIANPEDMEKLSKMFEGKELYIAVGSDVVKNASCYKAEPSSTSIHKINHIIFIRHGEDASPTYKKMARNLIDGDIIYQKLPKLFEDISSSKIRDNIDQKRDISNLIDVVAQRFIYENKLYLREPEYKHIWQAKEIYVSKFGATPIECLEAMKKEITQRGYTYNKILDYVKRDDVNSVCVLKGSEEKQCIAFATAHQVDTNKLYDEVKDLDLARKIREVATGKIASIGIMVSKKTKAIANINQYLITEILTELRSRDFTYCIFNPIEPLKDQSKIQEDLKRQGFINIGEEKGKAIFAVDMRTPIILFKDVEKTLKAPLNKNLRLQKTISKAHYKLLDCITSMYPGQLVISFNTSAIYNKIMAKVAQLNDVKLSPSKRGEKGRYMAVPFGEALVDVVVPNTVTKSLHTEKYFNGDLRGFTIKERKNYAVLEDQIKTIHSFNRPVILVDDLLHRGYRFEKIMPLIKSLGIDVKAMVTGVLTGNGQDLMLKQGIKVESAYFIPSIKIWINEKDFYPFIGGDRIHGKGEGGMNLIMPYAYPEFIGDGKEENIYKFSKTCLENTYEILKVLEEEYQEEFQQKLTVNRIGEVIAYPKVPDFGEGLVARENVSSSVVVKDAFVQLRRLATSKDREAEKNGK